MASSRFSNKIKPPKKQTSGISEQLPQILKYPQLLGFEEYGQVVKDIFSYIIPHYGHVGLSVLVYRQPQKDNVVIVCGDWLGNRIDVVDVNDPTDIQELASDFLVKDVITFCEFMKTAAIEQAQYFFAIDARGLLLVDVQLSLNKFASPGMVKDVFGKLYRTPETKKIEIIDDRAVEYIGKATGGYAGDLIIKPSRFRLNHHQEENTYSPMYIEVVR